MTGYVMGLQRTRGTIYKAALLQLYWTLSPGIVLNHSGNAAGGQMTKPAQRNAGTRCQSKFVYVIRWLTSIATNRCINSSMKYINKKYTRRELVTLVWCGEK